MSPDDRAAFAERLRLQFAARYRELSIDVDPARFALRLRGAGVPEVSLPLSPLYNQSQRHPRRTATLIAEFVAASESQLAPRSPVVLALPRVLWCVRTREYLDGHSGAEELLTTEVAGSLIAFVAESLPNSIMRGVPRTEWSTLGEDALRSAADSNTAARFASLTKRITATERVPRDGWRLSGDLLFQGSVLVVNAVLRALVDRAGGDVLLAVPDRGIVFAQPQGDTDTVRFRQRVVRTYRETLQPCSREVLVTDGRELRVVPLERRDSLSLLDRLRG